jgi:hypothetical protein
LLRGEGRIPDVTVETTTRMIVARCRFHIRL